MDAWIPVTLCAALAQTARFMLQRHLAAGRLSASGATFARFVWSAPLAALLVWAYARSSGQALPGPGAAFWAFAVAGGTAQILATICVVALFSHRNFAVGITLKKTEVLLSVVAGLAILGEGVAPAGVAAILAGLAGVLLLSDPPEASGPWRRRVLNRAAGLGLASGAFFAVSGVGYRGASLSLEGGDVFLRAALTLACVTAFQTVALGGWLLWRQRGEVARVFAHWRVTSLVGLTSMAGSLCWFTAFTLQTVGYVNAVGQVELVFSLLATRFFYREPVSRRELAGMAVLAGSVVALVLVA